VRPERGDDVRLESTEGRALLSRIERDYPARPAAGVAHAPGHRLIERDADDVMARRIEDADADLAWYVLRTATRQERKAEEHLLEAGFSVHLPRLTDDMRLGRKRETVHKPLFEGYLFAGLPAGRALEEFQVEGVSGPLRFGADRQPSQVAFGAVVGLVLAELAGAFDKTRKQRARLAPLEPGEWVRIQNGPFMGFTAQVLQMTSRQRVKLLVAVFGRATETEIAHAEVEKVA